MTRRLIWIVVVVAVLGGLGYFAYDRYLGQELRQGRDLRDALADELASAGIAFTSMKYDWRRRRVVAHDLVATELPDGVSAFTIKKAVYRGAEPARISAALANGDSIEKPVSLIADLALSDVTIGFDDGAEFKQASLMMKRVSLGKAVSRDGGKADNPLLRAADLARRFHVRLFEAKDARYWHPNSQSTFEQKLLRLEDYRGGNFSEFRLEGLSLVVAVVIRAKLDEYFVESVKARGFLDTFHRSAAYGAFVAAETDIASAFAQLAAGDVETAGEGDDDKPTSPAFPSFAESAIVRGDEALIGFELLIPGAGRIAFEEISSTDRQFVNGLELGGRGKIVGLELQFTMLTRMLTAGLDLAGVDLASAAGDAGEEVQAWLAAHSGKNVSEDGPIAAALQTEDDAAVDDKNEANREKPDVQPNEQDEQDEESEKQPQERAEKKRVQRPDPGTAGMGIEPAEPQGENGRRSGEQNDQVPAGPRDGDMEQGPAAPVPEVWGNKIRPPDGPPQLDNKAIAEIIRKLGFDDLRIDSESVTGFDENTKVYEVSRFIFEMHDFWNLGFDLRLSGMGALEDLGNLPSGGIDWWQGPAAKAVGDRFMKEGHFDGLSFTYRERGFLTRLLQLIAEKRKTTVEKLVSGAVSGWFSEENGEALLQADGLKEAVKSFLMTPQTFSIRFRPAQPIPFNAFPVMNKEKTPVPEMADRLGMILIFNEESFENFKKTAPISSDIEGEQD